MCYLYYHAHAYSIPLQSITAHISIVDVLARVRLSQVFVNDQVLPWSVRHAGIEGPDLEAIYKFPVPPGAAVCEFEAVLDDGTTVVGIVKEKDEAKKEYDAAIASGKQAALAVHERTDIFTISVGNIPNKATVTINLTYVIELNDDGDADQVRFVLPTTIAEKYGYDSTGRTSVHTSSTANYKLNIIASVQMNQPIRSIASPSHSVEVHLGVLEPHESDMDSDFEPKHAHVTLAAEAWLDRDLVITIKSGGLDAPRCTSEVYQPVTYASAPSVFTSSESSGQPPETTALALTLVPRFNLPPIASQEYILVADRSGSMAGFKIKTLQAALQLLLRSLPPSGSFIQIISFGSRHSLLFNGRSEPYNEHSLQVASSHVDTMRADYGGTEIRNALVEAAFKFRRTDIPTSIFVLTDGEVSDLDGVLSAVRASTKVGKGEAPLRVFSLGIGNAVDAALVGGIAREGDGVAQFVGEGERMEAKLIKLLRSARSPAVRDVTIEWTPQLSKLAELDTDDFEMVETIAPPKPATPAPKAKISLFDTNYQAEAIPSNPIPPPNTPVALPAFEAVQQAPSSIPCIYSGSRTVVYAILATNKVSESVTLRAKTEGGDELELVIPVRQCTSTPLSNSKLKTVSEIAPVPLIHTLAARKLLGDLEENTTWSSPIVRAKMVRLGITYNLASKHTSFVAVEPDTSEKEDHGVHWRWKRQITVSNLPEANSAQSRPGWGYVSSGAPKTRILARSVAAPTLPQMSTLGSQLHMKKRASSPVYDSVRGGGVVNSASSMLYGRSALAAPPPPPTPGRGGVPPPASSDRRSMASTRYNDGEWQQEGSAMPSSPRNRSVQKEKDSATAEKKRRSSASSSTQAHNVPDNKDDQRAQLVRLQAFDGSFASVSDICAILGISTPAVPATLQAAPSKEIIWATCIALAWLKKVCAKEREEWEVIAMKAEGFIATVLPNAADVQRAAQSLF